eukprot:4748471-Alexandrium_andersonii.AAC.1
MYGRLGRVPGFLSGGQNGQGLLHGHTACHRCAGGIALACASAPARVRGPWPRQISQEAA